MKVLCAWRKYFCRCSLVFLGAIGMAALYAEPAQAECFPRGCIDQLERLYLSRSADALFISTAGDEALLNCSLSEDVYMTLSVDNSLFREFLAMLLTAKASDYDAFIRIHEGSTGCTVAYVVIEASRAGEGRVPGRGVGVGRPGTPWRVGSPLFMRPRRAA
jgi:hypothetical protein